MKEILFTGSGTALVTPFKADLSIDFETIEKLVEYQIENGTDAIIACGTTGESSTMSTEEHLKTIEFILEKVNGRIPVIAGTGSNDTTYCVELSLKAKELGVQGLLLVTPYYNKTSQKGLIEHFTYVADNVKMPCIVYNVPGRTGLNILPDTYYVLSKNQYIVATKEANGNVSAAMKTMSLCGDNLHVYSGDDIQTFPLIALGAKGIISVFSNALPKEMSQLAHAVLDGNLAKGREITNKYYEFFEKLAIDVNPMPVKEAMNQMGLIQSGCRMPLTDMSDENKKTITTLLTKYGLL